MNHLGVLTCAHYAFPPNSLHYCGPHQSTTIKEYLQAQIAEPRLSTLLSQFETLYPYLQCIAEANNIKDPFDIRVVEAYWLGNELLQHVSMKQIYNHYTERLQLPKRITQNELKWLFGKITTGAKAHHTFHVMNIFTRTGHHTVQHTVESIDNCRVSWGKVITLDQNAVIVQYQPIICQDGTLQLGASTVRVVQNPFEYTIQKDSCVSFHWGVVCGLLTKAQITNLHTYTLQALQQANTTL